MRDALAGLDATIRYAVKANSNLAILQLMAAAGVGADIVSAGELWRALHAGIPAERIVFSGVGKSEDEIAGALTAGIARFNVESLDELHVLQRVAQAQDVTARAAVRVNPDVDAHTHAKISTGKSENKFGVSLDEARRWFAERKQLSHVRLDGLHVHIGSQILSVEPFRLALQRVAALWRELEQAGHPIGSIDVGGGLGVCYRAGQDRPVAAADYVGVIRAALAGYRGRLLLEPGRYLVAEAAIRRWPAAAAPTSSGSVLLWTSRGRPGHSPGGRRPSTSNGSPGSRPSGRRGWRWRRSWSTTTGGR